MRQNDETFFRFALELTIKETLIKRANQSSWPLAFAVPGGTSRLGLQARFMPGRSFVSLSRGTQC